MLGGGASIRAAQKDRRLISRVIAFQVDLPLEASLLRVFVTVQVDNEAVRESRSLNLFMLAVAR